MSNVRHSKPYVRGNTAPVTSTKKLNIERPKNYFKHYSEPNNRSNTTPTSSDSLKLSFENNLQAMKPKQMDAPPKSVNEIELEMTISTLQGKIFNYERKYEEKDKKIIELLGTITKLKTDLTSKENENEKISKLQSLINDKDADSNEQRRRIKELKNKIEKLEKMKIKEQEIKKEEMIEEEEDDEEDDDSLIYLYEEEMTKKRKFEESQKQQESQKPETSESLIFDAAPNHQSTNNTSPKKKEKKFNLKMKTISFKVYKEKLNDIFLMISSNDKILSEEFHNILMNQVMTENKSPILLFPILMKFIDFSKKNEDFKMLEASLNILLSLFIESNEFRKLNFKIPESLREEKSFIVENDINIINISNLNTFGKLENNRICSKSNVKIEINKQNDLNILDSKFLKKKSKEMKRNLKFFVEEILISTFNWFLEKVIFLKRNENTVGLIESISLKLLKITEILTNEVLKKNELCSSDLLIFSKFFDENIIKTLLFTPLVFDLNVRIQAMTLFSKIFSLNEETNQDDSIYLFFRISEILTLKNRLLSQNSFQDVFCYFNIILDFYSKILLDLKNVEFLKRNEKFDALIKNIVSFLENELNYYDSSDDEENEKNVKFESSEKSYCYFLIQKTLNILCFFSKLIDLKECTNNDYDLLSLYSTLKYHQKYLKNFEFLSKY
eukprot:gene1797-939_t